MKLIGLTGGIASGKSTVGRLLRDAGVAVIDADVLARDAVAVGSAGLTAVVERFGSGVLAGDGSLDRKALGAIVFAYDAARRDLNGIVHPEVARLAVERLDALRDSGAAVAVYEVPLLFENGLDAMMDATILVACQDDVQLQRIMARDGLGEPGARARVAAQMPQSEKRRRARVVIDNDGSLDDLRARTVDAWREATGASLSWWGKGMATKKKPAGEPEKVHKAGLQKDDAAWLYYVDKQCNVVRMARGVAKAKTEVVVVTGLKREKGWDYFVDNDGDVAREPE